MAALARRGRGPAPDGRRDRSLPPIVPRAARGGRSRSPSPRSGSGSSTASAAGSAYNEAVAFRLDGGSIGARSGRSLDELVRRHEVLRTTFPEADGGPCSSSCPRRRFDLAWSTSRLSRLPRDEEARRLAPIARRAGRSTWPAGPLLRGLRVRLGEHEHALLFSFHHIVFDGWSTGIFVRELSALYAAALAGERPSCRPLPVQYADFAVWQRQWLQGEVLERQLGYWRERLAGARASLELPTDRPRPAVPGGRRRAAPSLLALARS